LGEVLSRKVEVEKKLQAKTLSLNKMADATGGPTKKAWGAPVKTAVEIN
jgi:hypothetical protein